MQIELIKGKRLRTKRVVCLTITLLFLYSLFMGFQFATQNPEEFKTLVLEECDLV